ncbi:MAG: hypothetical protein M3Y76_13905 [Chloroflexota bacterium]|nr:hypothetical protein [Chloroflexota bacterium]
MTQSTSSPEENIAHLHELVLRLLARPFDPQPHLLAGSFPASLPFDVPFPDGYQIVGSFARTPEDILLLLDTEQSPAEVVAFYIQRMQAIGWSEPDILRRLHHEGGFTHMTQRRVSYITLCKGQRGPALMVSASRGQEESGKTQVRLNLDTRSRGSPCMQSSAIFMGVGALIPPLEPPPDGRQWGGGGGSDSESASTAATLDVENNTTLPLLAAHYVLQLEQAGWQRTGEGSSEPMAWSTWELYDKQNERWMAVFTLLEVPGMERKYYMQMNINWVGDKAQ